MLILRTVKYIFLFQTLEKAMFMHYKSFVSMRFIIVITKFLFTTAKLSGINTVHESRLHSWSDASKQSFASAYHVCPVSTDNVNVLSVLYYRPIKEMIYD
jgi:hypothetical protein